MMSLVDATSLRPVRLTAEERSRSVPIGTPSLMAVAEADAASRGTELVSKRGQGGDVEDTPAVVDDEPPVSFMVWPD
jgi:hypothetical protein